MQTVTGVDEFFNRVRRLVDSPAATKTVRKGVIAGLKVMGKQMVATAPVHSGLLKRSVGKPVFSRGTGRSARQKIVKGKVGINTGQKKATREGRRASFSPHGSMVALGTFPRWTGLSRRTEGFPGRRIKGGGRLGRPNGKKIAFRGFMSPNPFIRQAATATAQQAIERMTEVIRTDWDELIQAAKR